MDFNMDKLNNEVIREYDLQIFQNTKYFKFGLDAVCLANFAAGFRKKQNPRYMDMCAGTGIVGFIYARLGGMNRVDFLEKSPYYSELIRMNIGQNKFDARVYQIDLRKARGEFEGEVYDYITVNPPYMRADSGLKTINETKDMAKIEDGKDFLDQIFMTAFYLLKDGADLYMVHRVERLADIFVSSRKNKLEIKNLQFIRNRGAKKSSLVLLRFVKNAGIFMEILDDYII